MSQPLDLAARINHALIAYAPAPAAAATPLRDALESAVRNPGHLVRASLVLEAADSQGIPRTQAEQLACAVEYWHLASLLLDDLPCMDDATERRGQPCIHKRFGESTAILASLALINRSYTLIHAAFSARPLAIRRQAIQLVDRVLGPSGLVGGQAHDLAFDASSNRGRDTGRIAWMKTGTLLWLCIALPSLWTRSSAHDRRALRRLCIHWGLAYQGVDDLKDLFASSTFLGKTTQRDTALGRPNLALAIGVPAAHARVQRLLRLAGLTIQHLVAENPRHLYLARWHAQVFVARELALCAA